MLIIGDISGIQDFIFDLPHEGKGGTARALRARSFYVQILTEVIAYRIQNVLGLERDTLLFCAAGKFAIEGESSFESASNLLSQEIKSIEEWLARETTGALRVTVTSHPDALEGVSSVVRYERAMAKFQHAKLRTWSSLATSDGRWRPERLVLPSRQRAEVWETFRRIGATLPRSRRLRIIEDPNAQLDATPDGTTFGLPGFRAFLGSVNPSPGPIALEADLSGVRVPGIDSTPQIYRPLARHIPTQADGLPIWFEEIAQHSKGARYLGILKMDADSLGVAIRDRLSRAESLRELSTFSTELDDFFAIELTNLLQQKEWTLTYTVFSGGDDLLLVGPWDKMLDLAGLIQERFRAQFSQSGLTLSGGLAIVRVRYPLRRGAAQAEELLEGAKNNLAPLARDPKDQLATLGQLWKWQHHNEIISTGKRLVRWIGSQDAHRGWLHSLLHFTLMRRGEIPGTSRTEQLTASARLAYQVERNYPKSSGRRTTPQGMELRRWIDRILEEFDSYETTEDPQILFLPAIVRYALLATRSESKEDEL